MNRDETLTAEAIGERGAILATYLGGPGATVRSMMARVDASHANSRAARVTGEYTSDGTHWGPGKGRTLASREPRTIDGRFYSGWIVE